MKTKILAISLLISIGLFLVYTNLISPLITPDLSNPKELNYETAEKVLDAHNKKITKSNIYAKLTIAINGNSTTMEYYHAPPNHYLIKSDSINWIGLNDEYLWMYFPDSRKYLSSTPEDISYMIPDIIPDLKGYKLFLDETKNKNYKIKAIPEEDTSSPIITLKRTYGAFFFFRTMLAIPFKSFIFPFWYICIYVPTTITFFSVTCSAFLYPAIF